MPRHHGAELFLGKFLRNPETRAVPTLQDLSRYRFYRNRLSLVEHPE